MRVVGEGIVQQTCKRAKMSSVNSFIHTQHKLTAAANSYMHAVTTFMPQHQIINKIKVEDGTLFRVM